MKTQPETEMTRIIHPATRLGPVHYTTADLERQISFYQDILGFKLHWREDRSAGLGAGKEDLLRLSEEAGARRARGTTGLYHTAFLVPNRWEHANLLKRIAETRTPIQGMSDHGTHHAIYLPDAEGNGIELAWDRPQGEWPKTLSEMMRRNRGLAPEEVFRGLEEKSEPWEGLDAGTKVGHVHLHVSQLSETDHFYRQVLGFEIPMEMVMDTAIFFSAGGYHHHIGTNVWQGVGAPPPPPGAIGLRHFSVILPDPSELENVLAGVEQAGLPIEPVDAGLGTGFLVRDPAGNGVRLSVES